MTLPASGAIAFSCINTELGLTSTAQISMNDTAVRTLFGQASGAICMNTGHGKSSSTPPGAPTSVSASVVSCSSATVSFTAPASNGGAAIDYYQAISSPGCITATGSSPITVSSLSPSTSYTFRVRAHNAKGYGCYSSSSGSITTNAPRGASAYTSSGTYTWVAPAGVTSISVVVIGAGGAGGTGASVYCPCCGVQYYTSAGAGAGGGMSFMNNFSVTAGNSYTVKVAQSCVPGTPGAGGSQFNTCSGGSGTYARATSGTRAAGGYGCNPGSPGKRATGIGGNGGDGGAGGYSGGGCSGGMNSGGAGGAAGYSGCGGGGGSGGYGYNCTGYNSTGGGGGGGSGARYNSGGGGGGIGIYGSCGTKVSCWSKGGPKAGSSGVAGRGGYAGPGGTSGSGTSGGSYGGGGGGGGGSAGGGAVRIVWPGCSRRFPASDVNT